MRSGETAGWALRPADNHAYRFFGAQAAWPDAQAVCAASGGHLVTVTGADEQAFVAVQGGVDF